MECQSTFLSERYKQASHPEAGIVFLGYSINGLQLRVSYFDDAILKPVSRRALA